MDSTSVKSSNNIPTPPRQVPVRQLTGSITSSTSTTSLSSTTTDETPPIRPPPSKPPTFPPPSRRSIRTKPQEESPTSTSNIPTFNSTPSISQNQVQIPSSLSSDPEPVLRHRKSLTTRMPSATASGTGSLRLNPATVKEELNILLNDTSGDKLLKFSDLYSYTKKINRFFTPSDYDFYYPQLVMELSECLDPLLDYLEMSLGFYLRTSASPGIENPEKDTEKRRRLNDHFRKVQTFQLIKGDIPPSEFDADGFPIEDWGFVPELKKKHSNHPGGNAKSSPQLVHLENSDESNGQWAFARRSNPLTSFQGLESSSRREGLGGMGGTIEGIGGEENGTMSSPGKGIIRVSKSEEKLVRLKNDSGDESKPPQKTNSHRQLLLQQSASNSTISNLTPKSIPTSLEREELKLLLKHEKAEQIMTFYDLAKIVRRELSRNGKINFKRSFSGGDLIDFLTENGYVTDRNCGIQLGIILQNKKLIFNSHFRPIEDTKDPIFSFSKWALFFKFHKSVRLFGGRLTSIMSDHRHIDGSLHVPRLLICLCDAIFALGGHQAEGIFRKSESKAAQQQVKDQIEAGEYDQLKITDPHVAANVLTSWFLELEQSVIPQVYYNIISRTKQLPDCENFVLSLPDESRFVTTFLIRFLGRLAQPEFVESTKMSPSNLAMVFSPCLFRLDDIEPEHVLEINAGATSLLTKLINAAIPHPDTYLLEGLRSP